MLLRFGIVRAFYLLAGLALASSSNAQIIGVGTHFGFGDRDVRASMQLVSQLGVDSIRDDIFWSHVERRRGVYAIPDSISRALAEAAARNVKVLLILGYGNDLYGPRQKPLSPAMKAAYLRYVEFVVASLKGKVWGYQVWNEWDWKTGGYSAGDVDGYLDLLRAVSPLIRTLDPDAKILSSAVTYKGLESGWLDSALEKGLAREVDGIAINPYVQSLGAGRNSAREVVRWVRAIRSQLDAAQSKAVGLYITEVGWTSVGEFNRKRVATDLEGTLKGLMGTGVVAGVWWYNLQDDGKNPSDGEHNYGLVDHDLKPKEAFTTMRRILKER